MHKTGHLNLHFLMMQTARHYCNSFGRLDFENLDQLRNMLNPKVNSF